MVDSVRGSNMTAEERELRRLEHLAWLLDARFSIPGTPIRIGIDGIIGLIPGIGDFASLLPTLYIVIRAQQLGAPGYLILLMLANALADWLVGTIPILGDIFDIAFKANLRNVGLLRRYLEDRIT